MKKMFGFAAAGAALFGMTAAADVLYENAPDFGSVATVDQEFDDFPDFSSYMVADMNFGGGNIINTVTTYMTTAGDWSGVTQARLHLFSGAGALPDVGDDPTSSGIVNVTWTDNGDGTGTLVASGLNVAVSGDMWVGLTALTNFGSQGQNFHFAGLGGNGDVDAIRNPGGAFGWPDLTGWNPMNSVASWDEMAILVEGVVPTPAALALLGVAGLAARRRRRA